MYYKKKIIILEKNIYIHIYIPNFCFIAENEVVEPNCAQLAEYCSSWLDFIKKQREGNTWGKSGPFNSKEKYLSLSTRTVLSLTFKNENNFQFILYYYKYLYYLLLFL